MNNISMWKTTYPSLLTRTMFDDVFTGVFSDWERTYRRNTQGYPLVDIVREENGSVVMEFALAGWRKSDLHIDAQPEKNTITVSGSVSEEADEVKPQRRIARRNFTKSFVNYDSNLDLAHTTAKFEDGLLTVTVPQRPETKALTVDIL